MTCSCSRAAAACPPISPPRWATGAKGKGCGVMDVDTLRQCDATFSAPALSLAPEASGTLSFSFAGAKFQKFRPLGLIVDVTDQGTNVVNAAGAVTETLHAYDFEDLIEITKVEFSDIPRTLNANPLPLSVYGRRMGRAMYVGFMGTLTPASTSLNIDLKNVCKTVANGGMGLTLRVRGVLHGWALRGGTGGDDEEPESTTFPAS